MSRIIFEDFSKNSTLKDKVYLSLREMLISGKIKPGTRLPEEDLAKQMNISRAPIREALNLLEREGFITIIPRKGAMVTEVTPEDMRNIWEMRLLLEPYAARISTHRIPDEEIACVDALLRESMEKPDDLDLYMHCDLVLHEMLYKHVGNHYLADSIAMTATHSLRVRYCIEYTSSLSQQAVRDVSREHQTVLDALKRRNEEEVFLRLKEHISNSLVRCQRSIESRQSQIE